MAAAARAAGWDPVAVDAEPAMVLAALARHPGASGVVGALPDLPFADGVFSAVGANFVVNHAPDPRAAVAELGRVCVPGGRVTLTVWPERLIAVNQLWNDVMLGAGVEPPPRQALPAPLDFERSPAGLAGLLSGAGLHDVEVAEPEVVLRVAPADLWRAAEGGIATIGAVYRSQPPERRTALRRTYDTVTAAAADDGVLVLPGTALLASGTAGRHREGTG